MSQIKSRDTKPELTLRKLLYSSGLRNYRLHSKKIIGKPDIIFPRLKIIIFIDGCQWHKCKKHYVPPKTNIAFWLIKINRNIKRDIIVDKQLKKLGWKVIRVWEHDLKKNKINQRLSDIIKSIKNGKNV